MIIARSFARIHETNLKVGSNCLSQLSGMKKCILGFTEAGNLALVVRRQERLQPDWLWGCCRDDGSPRSYFR